MTKKQIKYWELPPNELRQYIIDNWAADEYMDIGDAIHNLYEHTRPRDWLEVKDDALDLWQSMFKQEIEDESPVYGVIAGACAAAAAGVYCPPNNATAGQMEDIVKRYLNNNPAVRHLSADTIINRALSLVFPCPENKQPGGRNL